MTGRRTLEARLGAPDAATIERLLAESRAGTFVLRPRGASRGRDILLDTSDWAMARRGVILALRHRGAAADLEASRSRPGAPPWREVRRILEPLDRPPRVPPRLGDGPLARSLAAVAARRPLSAVAELAFVRRRLDARDASGELAARVVVESVSATLPGSTLSMRFDEVAVAPVAGREASAAALVAALRARGLRAEAHSGHARALAALHGEAVFASRFAGRVSPHR